MQMNSHMAYPSKSNNISALNQASKSQTEELRQDTIPAPKIKAPARHRFGSKGRAGILRESQGDIQLASSCIHIHIYRNYICFRNPKKSSKNGKRSRTKSRAEERDCELVPSQLSCW